MDVQPTVPGCPFPEEMPHPQGGAWVDGGLMGERKNETKKEKESEKKMFLQHILN